MPCNPRSVSALGIWCAQDAACNVGIIQDEDQMKSSLPAPTKAEERRFEIIKREIGCIVCIEANLYSEANAHHILSAGKRISHLATIPLCNYHHTGQISIHGTRKDFIEDYGTEMKLLEKTNKLVAEFESMTVGGAG